MSEQLVRLRHLAEQAQQEVRRDRRARCWLFHSWSKWDTAGRQQSRLCLGCGLREDRVIGPCAHVWHTYFSGNITVPGHSDLATGIVHDQQCRQCGDLRRLVHTNSP